MSSSKIPHGNESQNLETLLQETMHRRWDNARPRVRLETKMQKAIATHQTRKRTHTFLKTVAWSSAVIASLIVLLMILNVPINIDQFDFANAGRQRRVAGHRVFGNEMELSDFYYHEPYPNGRSLVDAPLFIRVTVRAINKPTADYRLFLHVVDEQGQLIAQKNQPLLDDNKPTLLWVQNDSTTVDVSFPRKNLPKIYEIQIGLYDLLTGKRLLTDTGDDIVIFAPQPSPLQDTNITPPPTHYPVVSVSTEPAKTLVADAASVWDCSSTQSTYDFTPMPQPTTAPPPTRNPNATSRPTRVRTTRVPRTPKPMPTIGYLSASNQWKTYSDSKYGLTFQYPEDWWLNGGPFIPTNNPGMRIPYDGSFISILNYSPTRAPFQLPAEGMGIDVSLSPAFCDGKTLEEVAMPEEATQALSPLEPQAPVGGLPAFRQKIMFKGNFKPTEAIQVLIPRGKWLYRFVAIPANSEQMDAFEHFLATFTTP